ncbi:hypothetical protein ACQKWADRAFT_220568 [Trichoderma austrokoningii]
MLVRYGVLYAMLAWTSCSLSQGGGNKALLVPVFKGAVSEENLFRKKSCMRSKTYWRCDESRTLSYRERCNRWQGDAIAACARACACVCVCVNSTAARDSSQTETQVALLACGKAAAAAKRNMRRYRRVPLLPPSPRL